MKVKEGSRSITRAWEFKANLNNVETLKRELGRERVVGEGRKGEKGEKRERRRAEWRY